MKIDQVIPRSWRALAVAGAAFAFLVASLTLLVVDLVDAPPDAESIDVGFLQDMISHHEQAITLSNYELENGATPGIQIFAREILLQQSFEIGSMDRQLSMWGYNRQARSDVAMQWMGMNFDPQQMPGMASENELLALREASGEDADALFVALMIDHHRGGVAMATAAMQSDNPWVRDLAGRMERNQRIEIDEMQAARDRAGLTADPDGFEPGPFPDMADMD